MKEDAEVGVAFETGRDWSAAATPVDGIRFLPDPIAGTSEEHGVAAAVYEAFAAALSPLAPLTRRYL